MDFNAMKLPELKAEAKKRNLKGFSTMKKADLVSALIASEPKPAKPESFIDGIKATFANMRESRSNKGRNAGQDGKVTKPQPWQIKDLNFRLQNGNEHAKLTGKQSRRVRKAERKVGCAEFTYV